MGVVKRRHLFVTPSAYGAGSGASSRAGLGVVRANPRPSATGFVLVEMLYIEDTLGESADASRAGEPAAARPREARPPREVSPRAVA